MAESKENSLDCIVLGIGNPLLDISASVPDDVFERYGVEKARAILAEERQLPLYQELVDNYPVEYIAGGATQNSLRIAQWMLRQPHSAAYMGCIGHDEFGRQLKECAENEGLFVHYQEDPNTPTGTCAVLISDKERSLVANLAAANKFSADHLDTPVAKELVEKAKVIYIAGFVLTVSVDAISRIGLEAAEKNKIFCMNLSAPFLIEFFRDQMNACLPFCDFVFGNENEAEKFGEIRGWGTDLREIAIKLSALPKTSGLRGRVVVFTQGSTSTIVAANGVVTEYPVEPLAKELLVDTNGAGDSFVGAFIAQLALDKDLSECVRAGHWAARQIIQRSGCSFPSNCDFS